MQAERINQRKESDPGYIVVDEVVGQFDQRLKKLGLVVEEVAA